MENQSHYKKHHHRSEHWIVVKGTALVEIDDSKKLVFENESAYIPLGATHRLSNPGKCASYFNRSTDWSIY